MSPYYLFLVTAIFTAGIQGMSLLHALSSRQPLTGQLPLAGVSLWAIGMTYVFSSPTPIFSFGLLLTSAQLGLFHLFAYRFTRRHINLPGYQGALSLFLSLLLPLLAVFPVFGQEVTLVLYAFIGLVSTLLLLLYCERIRQILVSKQISLMLVIGFGLITLGHFLTFCYLIVNPVTSTNPPQWLAIIMLLAYPFLHKGVYLLQRIPRKFSISRPVVFHTTLFTIVGLYMLGLSGLTMFFDALAFDWTYTTQLVLLGASSFPLCYLMASTKIRSRILVWVNKHFFSAQFDYRDTWRKLSRAMEPKQGSEHGTKQVLKTMLCAINHPTGAYYQKKQGQWICAAALGEELDNEGAQALSRFADGITEMPWIVDVEEAIKHPERYPTQLCAIETLHDKHIHWLVPVVSNNDLVGLWLISQGDKPSWPLNWETRDFTNALAHQMESYLKGKETLQRLSEHAQLAAFNQTSAFVIHDMKNVFAQLSMINKNAEAHKRNPEFVDDMLNTLTSMEGRMSKMLAQLTNKQRSPEISRTQVLLNEWLTHLDNEGTLNKPQGTLEFIQNDELNACTLFIDRERLTNVTKHLVDNAFYAVKDKSDGCVKVSCELFENHVIISVNDNGVGMTPDFIKNKLFKPFETTKGNAGMGLGVYDAKEFAEQNGGLLSVDSEVNKGTTVSLRLPRSGQ